MATIKIETDMNVDAARTLFGWGLAVADLIVTPADGFKLRAGDLSVAALHYLVHNGAKQSMIDAIAGLAAGKASVPAAAELYLADKPDTKPWDKFVKESDVDPSTVPADKATIEMVTAAVIAKRHAKRFESIMAGTIPVKDSGGKRSAEAVWIDDAAEAEMKAKHDNAKREMPKGQALKDLRAKYVAAHAARFAKAYSDHVAAIAAGASIADDVLGF